MSSDRESLQRCQAFIQSNFHIDETLSNPEAYDLVLNTGQLSNGLPG